MIAECRSASCSSPAHIKWLPFLLVLYRKNAPFTNSRFAHRHLCHPPRSHCLHGRFHIRVLGFFPFTNLRKLTPKSFDTGQISDILLMSDFKRRFANGCSIDTTSFADAGSCTFSNVRSGLIVALLSIGTLIGAVCGAPYVYMCSSTFLRIHTRY